MMDDEPFLWFIAYGVLAIVCLTMLVALAMVCLPLALVSGPFWVFFAYRGLAAAVRTWRLTSW